MNTLGENVNSYRRHEISPKTSGGPKPVIVKSSAIQAEDHLRVSDSFL